MTKKRGGAKPHVYTPEFREMANAALARHNARRPMLPKCGAKRKSDGLPCQNLAMRNGRCHRHGGKTPTGAQWHRPQWPDKSAPDAMAKLNAKLQTLEKRRKEIERRKLRMTPEERERYDKWHRDRPLGTQEKRAALRDMRQRDLEARELFSPSGAPAPEPNAETQSINSELEQIEALRVKLTAKIAEAGRWKDVFG